MAEPSLLEAHEILERAKGGQDESSIRAVRAIVEMYEAAGRTDKAAQWGRDLPARE